MFQQVVQGAITRCRKRHRILVKLSLSAPQSISRYRLTASPRDRRGNATCLKMGAFVVPISIGRSSSQGQGNRSTRKRPKAPRASCDQLRRRSRLPLKAAQVPRLDLRQHFFTLPPELAVTQRITSFWHVKVSQFGTRRARCSSRSPCRELRGVSCCGSSTQRLVIENVPNEARRSVSK